MKFISNEFLHSKFTNIFIKVDFSLLLSDQPTTINNTIVLLTPKFLNASLQYLQCNIPVFEMGGSLE